MDSASASADTLRKQIADTENELKGLKEQLARVEVQDGIAGLGVSEGDNVTEGSPGSKWPLAEEEYRRYGRQMIVPSIGIHGIYSSSLCVLSLADMRNRSNASQGCFYSHRRGRRSRLPCCCISRRRWRGHHRPRRRR